MIPMRIVSPVVGPWALAPVYSRREPRPAARRSRQIAGTDGSFRGSAAFVPGMAARDTPDEAAGLARHARVRRPGPDCFVCPSRKASMHNTLRLLVLASAFSGLSALAQPAPEVTLTRLDCGNGFNDQRRFSDTFAYSEPK